jgi:hypothetical protein
MVVDLKRSFCKVTALVQFEYNYLKMTHTTVGKDQMQDI